MPDYICFSRNSVDIILKTSLGIDIVTDGEMERGNYFLHFVRKIKGMNPDKLVDKKIRDGKF